MQKPLQNQKIAILAANGVNETHMTEIQKNLMRAGAFVRIISSDHAIINSWNGNAWGLNFAVDAALSSALGVDYNMLIIPGGERSIEKLARTAHTKRFITSFMSLKKPVGVIEDGEKVLSMAGLSSQESNVIIVDDNEVSVMITHFTESLEEMAAAA